MLSAIRKTFFSDKEVINLIRETPLVKDAIQARIEAANAEEKAERDRVLDAIAACGKRIQQLDREIDAQAKRNAAALDAWRIESDKLGDLTQQRSQAQQHEGHLCCDLSRCGEAALDQALMTLDWYAQEKTAEVRELELAVANFKRDAFGWLDIDKLKRRKGELSAARDRLTQTESAAKLCRSWIGARISPREQTARVEALMTSWKDW